MAEPTNSRVPKIRFKGCVGEWEATSYESILRVKHGFAFKGEHFASTGRYIVLTPGNFVEGGGFRYQGSKEKCYASEDFPKEYILSQNDLVVVMTEQAAGLIGTPLLVPQSGLFLHNQRLGLFEPFIEIRNDFLFPQCTTSSSKIAFSLTAAGTKVRHTSPQKIERLRVSVPSLAEQTQIGSFFRDLDRLIGLQQRKHDKLVTLKKAMLQKMFPQPGTPTPEIRFKGFEGEWVDTTLRTASEITTGFPFKSSDFSASGTYLVITNGNIQNELTFVDASVGNRISVQNSAGLNHFVLGVGDILVTMDGSVGRTAKVRETNQILAQRVGRLVAKLNPEFLYQALNTGQFLEQMTAISHGGTIKHISLGELGDYLFLVPSDLEEQQKIGHYFRTLDELIAKHAVQLAKLKQLKSSCLERMFV